MNIEDFVCDSKKTKCCLRVYSNGNSIIFFKESIIVPKMSIPESFISYIRNEINDEQYKYIVLKNIKNISTYDIFINNRNIIGIEYCFRHFLVYMKLKEM